MWLSCKKIFYLKKNMQFLTCEECDFMVHKNSALITNFPGAVTYMLETCDEWDPILHKCEEYDLWRIRFYTAAWVLTISNISISEC